MSGFFFHREQPEQPASKPKHPEPSLMGFVQAQAITTSAIFAMLVSKGVLTADEAAGYMNEIGSVLERDVDGAAGSTAGNMLRAYGQALAAADE